MSRLGRAGGSLAALLLLQSLSGCSSKAPATAGDAKSNEGPRRGAIVMQFPLEKYTLANGLEVVLHVDRRSPIVAVNLWYHVGSKDEPAGRNGFAHLFEHLMFEGSRHVGEDQFWTLLDRAGAFATNGTTSTDRTNYFEVMPASQLGLALWLESDRMGSLLDHVSQASLDSQRAIVKNERRQRYENVADGLLPLFVREALFPPGHPYHHGSIGTHEDLDRATMDDVKAFFRTYYVPNNATLTVAGSFEPAEAKAMVEKYFGSIPRGEAPPVRKGPSPPPRLGQRRLVIETGASKPKVQISWASPPAFTAEAAALDVAGGVLERVLLPKALIDKKLATDVDVAIEPGQLAGQFHVRVGLRPGVDPDAVVAAVDGALEQMRTVPREPEEIEATAAMRYTHIIYAIEKVGDRADRFNAYNHFVGDPAFLQKDAERYQSLQPHELQAAVAAHLMGGDRVVAVIKPTPGAPLAGRVVSGLPGAGAEPPRAPSAQVAERPWADEAFRKSPPPAGAQPAFAPPAFEEARLSNGVRVVIAPRRDLPIASVRVVVRGGADQGEGAAGAMMGQLLLSGTTRRKGRYLTTALNELGAERESYTTFDATVLSAKVLSTRLMRTLELLADALRSPAFAQAEVDRVKAQRRAQLGWRASDPKAELAARVSEALYPEGHPYRDGLLGTRAGIDAVTREKLVRFHQETVRPDRVTVVVTGDVDRASVMTALEALLGGWAPEGQAAAPRPLPALPSPLPSPSPGKRRVVLADLRGAAQSQVAVACVGPAPASPDFEPMLVLNTLIGGMFTSRLNMSLREEHGYTYYVSSSLVPRRGGGPLVVSGGVARERTAEAVAEVLSSLEKMRREGLSEAELETAKSHLIEELPAKLETASTTAFELADLWAHDRPVEGYTRRAERIRAVTLDEVRRVAATYLAPERLSVVVVGDASVVEAPLAALNLGPISKTGSAAGAQAEPPAEGAK